MQFVKVDMSCFNYIYLYMDDSWPINPDLTYCNTAYILCVGKRIVKVKKLNSEIFSLLTHTLL